MSDRVVVDASLAIKWLVQEEDSELAHALLSSWIQNETARFAPTLLRYEVVNALHRRVIRDELTLDAATAFADRLQSSQIEFFHPPELHRLALRVATQAGQGAVYDSHYLALAQHLDCELWTADARFARAAGTANNRVRLLREWSTTEH